MDNDFLGKIDRNNLDNKIVVVSVYLTPVRDMVSFKRDQLIAAIFDAETIAKELRRAQKIYFPEDYKPSTEERLFTGFYGLSRAFEACLDFMRQSYIYRSKTARELIKKAELLINKIEDDIHGN